MTTVPRLPSNATNREIVSYVHHYYPNLGPLLNQMFQRLRDEVEDHKSIEELEEEIHELEEQNNGLKMDLQDDNRRLLIERNCKCPHCGSPIELPQEAQK